MGCANPKDLSCQHHASALFFRYGLEEELRSSECLSCRRAPQAQQSTDQPTHESSFTQENLWPTLIK